jgi:predicted dehydrogenase
MSTSLNPALADLHPPPAPAVRTRLGFLGLGWIGRMRLAALADADLAEIHALSDPDPGAVAEAAAAAPGAMIADSLDALLEMDLDGLVIATPSALHAAQAAKALERGIAVFCQKPIARTGAEARALTALAREADRPLGVDFCYRHLAGMSEVRQALRGGALGRLFAVDLVFHNAYGPDKPWFRDLAQAGGGCLMDLGTHLIDLLLWCLDRPRVTRLDARIFAGGRPLPRPADRVEDYAALDLDLEGGVHARLACSWNLSAGCDAVIGAAFHGSDGALVLRNLDGSYYDFVVERMRGTARERIAGPPDAWGGRALADWTGRVARGEGFDPAEDPAAVPLLLDRAYGR